MGVQAGLLDASIFPLRISVFHDQPRQQGGPSLQGAHSITAVAECCKSECQGMEKEQTGRTGDNLEVSRLGNWANVVPYPRWGMLEKTEFWGEHSELSSEHFKHERMSFVYFLNMEHKRIPSLSQIPYFKKKAIKDNLTQHLAPQKQYQNPKYGISYMERTLRFMQHQSPHFIYKLRLRRVKGFAQSHTSSVMKVHLPNDKSPRIFFHSFSYLEIHEHFKSPNKNCSYLGKNQKKPHHSLCYAHSSEGAIIQSLQLRQLSSHPTQIP